MKPVRLKASRRIKPWGSENLDPLFPRSRRKIGEIWYTHSSSLPILVKFLFTSRNLSIQLHPEGPAGKTEMWHILRADPGAKIAIGFKKPIRREHLKNACQSGGIVEYLRWIPVAAGETYFVPARTVHAIGAGIALCEIQQNSDITYRLHDFDLGRELHLEQAVPIALLNRHPGASVPKSLSRGRVSLAHCEYFTTEAIATHKDFEFQPEDSQLVIFLEGRGEIAGAPFAAGEVWFLPPEAGPVRITTSGYVRVLRTSVPSSSNS